MNLIPISPTKAKELLAANTHNRNVKEGHVKNLAEDMLAGRWIEKTGESIKISKKGVLLDGQHRLLAVIRANRTIRFEIHEDLDDKIMDVIDSGVKRTAGDAFRLKEIKNASTTPAIIKIVMGGKSGLRQDGVTNSGLTTKKVLEIYYEEPEFWDNVSTNASTWYKGCRAISQSLFGYCFVQVLRNSKKAVRAVEFFKGLATGKDTESSIVDLRNKLMNNSVSVKNKLTTEAKVEMIRTGWNAFLSGNKTSRSQNTDVWL